MNSKWIVLIVLALIFLMGPSTLVRAEDSAMSVDSSTAVSTADTMQKTETAPVSNKKIETKDIQQALLQAGYYKGTVDGVMGTKTHKAIRAFQKDNGLHVDGKCGAKTWAKLKEHLTESVKTETSIAKDLAATTQTKPASSVGGLPAEDFSSLDKKDLKQKLIS